MKNIVKDKEEIIKNVENYINIIEKEYKEFVKIPENLCCKEILRIEKLGTISLFVRDNVFYFPLEAYTIIERLKEHKDYGKNKMHKLYDSNTLLNNNNDFMDFIEHLILRGATALDYFKEVLLHETMHFCGSNGNSALMEGLNEYLTRKLALKYKLTTNGCAYYKEVKIILLLEELFGTEKLIKIAFSKSNESIEKILNSLEDISFFFELDSIMNEEFYNKYYRFKFSNPFDKARKYEDINYSSALKLIENYKKSKLARRRL